MTKTLQLVLLTIGAVLGLIAVIVTGLLASSTIILIDGKPYTEIKDYSPRVPVDGIISGCHAMSPECGVCSDTNTHKETLERENRCYKAL